MDAAVRDEQQSISTLHWVTICGATFIVIVAGGSTWVVTLYTRRLIHAQKEIGALNQGLEARVRERTAELGRANEEIQRFAYIVTHDLRAPLVNIMGFTSELEESLKAIQSAFRATQTSAEVNPTDGPVAEEARTAVLEDLPEAIGFIRSSIRKMDRLINAILKLSREGRRVLTPEALRVDALLKNAAANVQGQRTTTALARWTSSPISGAECDSLIDFSADLCAPYCVELSDPEQISPSAVAKLNQQIAHGLHPPQWLHAVAAIRRKI